MGFGQCSISCVNGFFLPRFAFLASSSCADIEAMARFCFCCTRRGGRLWLRHPCFRLQLSFKEFMEALQAGVDKANKSKLDAQPELFITLVPDKANKTLFIIDKSVFYCYQMSSL